MKKTQLERIVAPLQRFIHLEYTSGVVLLLSVVAALIWANSSHSESYNHLWHTYFKIGTENFNLNYPLHIWINDGLMAIFFFLIGLELKREFIEGELSSFKKACLPMSAALGGMLVPALIYFSINQGTSGATGWGIPMATDIAFALALLSMVSKNIPVSIKIFLAALAVADDLGAVLVIAFFYTAEINFSALGVAGFFLLILVGGNMTGIRTRSFYILIGLCVWVGFLLSGVHATIAGVLVAFTIPAVSRINETYFSSHLKTLSADFEKEIPERGILTTPSQHNTIHEISVLTKAASTPLQTIEHALHPWVAFGIMPLFALSNSGVAIGSDFFDTLVNPISLGIILGLVVGKFVGITFFTWIMVKLKIAALPTGATWTHIAGVAILAGIGFTMSLFIAGLAFNEQLLVDEAKYGILIASLIAGTSGVLFLKLTTRKKTN